MSDLISRESLLVFIDNNFRSYWDYHTVQEFFNIITNAPAIPPQQPKEQGELFKKAVADALEEAANIKVNYTKSGRDDALTKLVEDVIQEAVESAISQYKEAIRDLIKRNAEGG